MVDAYDGWLIGLIHRFERGGGVRLIEESAALIRLHEGFRSKVYECTAGKLTVGYGRNLEDVGITRAEAEMLLQNDINAAIHSLTKYPFFLELDPVRQAVCVDMSFNLGAAGFSKFKRFHSALAGGFYDTAAAEMIDSRWAKQVGKRAQRLAKMMRTGEFLD